MVDVFVATFPVTQESFRKTFNTATMQFAINGKFEANPIQAADLEAVLASGFKLPDIDVPAALQPFAERWWSELREELQPLSGKRVDARFIGSIHIQ